MANADLRYQTSRRRPLAASRADRAAPGEASQSPRAAAQRLRSCRINAGQLLRSAGLLVLCLGLSYLPRGEKTPPQGSVVEASNLKF
jgi:hypothetical protein